MSKSFAARIASRANAVAVVPDKAANMLLVWSDCTPFFAKDPVPVEIAGLQLGDGGVARLGHSEGRHGYRIPSR